MILPQLKENENLDLVNVISDQHFTQPPARFTDASLIKKLDRQKKIIQFQIFKNQKGILHFW